MATTAAVVVLIGAVVLSQVTQFRIAFPPGQQSDASAPVLALPAAGEASPPWLPDGTPVFVVADEDGTAAVVEALSTHRVYLPDRLVGWCTSAEIFQDPHHYSEWGPRGDYIEDGVITVPTVDVAYGRPPGEPIPAGAYELRLDNRGDLRHTLVNDVLGIDLAATLMQQAATTVDLPPGEYLFYCRISGHRDAGMEFELVAE